MKELGGKGENDTSTIFILFFEYSREKGLTLKSKKDTIKETSLMNSH